jgi:GNAT superfamily N-acetyltransferase
VNPGTQTQPPEPSAAAPCQRLEFTAVTATAATTGSAVSIADLVRTAYAGSDPLPGLPAPDGAREDGASVARFLEGGGTVWMARDAVGDLVGAARVQRAGDDGWFVSRICVAPGQRGHGVGRRLLEWIEAQAECRGVRAILLDAVIERCVPPYYARLGYRVVSHHLAQDDKLLTEVLMEREPHTRRLPQPGFADDCGEAAAAALYWFLDGARLTAVAVPEPGSLTAALARAERSLPAGARLAGFDLWRGAPEEFRGMLGRIPGARAGIGPHVLHFDGGRAGVATHLMPRAHHRDLWAALRLYPGAETRTHSPYPVRHPGQSAD